MKNILIKNLHLDTFGLEDCVGRFSKYLKVWKVSNNLDRNKYKTKHIDISVGKNTSITDKIIKHSDFAELENCSKIKEVIDQLYSDEKKYGTLKANVRYRSKAADWNDAYADLERLREDTGINFRLSSVVFDTKIFKGKWDIEVGVDRIWPEIDAVTGLNNIWTKDLNRELELAKVDADITKATVIFVGILSESEKKELSRIVDESYMPEFTGYTNHNLSGTEYRRANYITKRGKHQQEIEKNTVPFIVVEKKWLGFDEEKIRQFYEKIKSYEKTEYLRSMDFKWPYFYDPQIKIEIASKACGKRIYSKYEMREERGIEYSLIQMRNEEKDILKKR